MNLSFGEYYSEHMVKHEIFFKRERKGELAFGYGS
jgi:hypothetical protein